MSYLLIWDVDGTLITSRGTGKRAMEKAFFDLYGVKEAFRDINMAGRLDTMILAEAYMLHGILNADEKEFFDLYCKYLEEELKKLTFPIAVAGILELLEFLSKKNGFYSVLGTGNIERGARIKLSVHDMNKFFPVGGFADNSKERWEVIEKAIAASCDYFGVNFKKENIYVIGDTDRDIECGRIVKVKTIGVATGRFSKKQLLEYGADYVFENLQNIEEFMCIFENKM